MKSINSLKHLKDFLRFQRTNNNSLTKIFSRKQKRNKHCPSHKRLTNISLIRKLSRHCNEESKKQEGERYEERNFRVYLLWIKKQKYLRTWYLALVSGSELWQCEESVKRQTSASQGEKPRIDQLCQPLYLRFLCSRTVKKYFLLLLKLLSLWCLIIAVPENYYSGQIKSTKI